MIALEDLKIYGVGPDSSTQKSLESRAVLDTHCLMGQIKRLNYPELK